jgi:tRNA threonylcarbamoyladenosine biosynthesis protein TsaB
MARIIALQSTYESVEVGLFDGTRCLAHHTLDKKEASGHLVPTIANLCEKQQWLLNSCTAIVVNQGPGPFSTLRTVIASANGLSFASDIPLIGVNALEATITEFDPDGDKNTLALFNAFGGDVYYAFRRAHTQDIITGVGSVVDACAPVSSDTLHIIGNAVSMHYEALQRLCSFCATVTVHHNIHHASLKTMAHIGIKYLHDGITGVQHLSPYYLKNKF